jgi:hypothetical protein
MPGLSLISKTRSGSLGVPDMDGCKMFLGAGFYCHAGHPSTSENKPGDFTCKQWKAESQSCPFRKEIP